MNKMKRILALGMAAAMVIGVTACGKPASKETAQATPTPAVQQTVEPFGTVKANEIKNINLDFTATVESIPVKEGQKVKKGDVLVVLDMREFNTQLKSKQDEMAIYKVEIKKLESKLTASEVSKGLDPESKKLISDLKFAQDTYDKAVNDLDSQWSLYETGAISQSEYDESKKSVQLKKQSLDNAKLAIESSQHSRQLGNGEISDNIRIQYLKAAQLESEIQTMKEKLNRSYIQDGKIVADFDNAIVYDIGYVAGDKVDQTKKVLTLMNADSIVVEANVSEEFIKDVKMGAKAEISPQADKSKKYNGKVIRIASKAVQQNGETVIPVQVSIDDRDDFLLPNFNVDVYIYK